MHSLRGESPRPTASIGLTPRQRQVMDMVLAGQPSKNIAADLGISQRTVENHRAAIIKRTGSKCLPALARMAFAADRNGVPALPSLSDPLNTENPDRESIANRRLIATAKQLQASPGGPRVLQIRRGSATAKARLF